MPDDSDLEFGESDDEAFFVVATQAESSTNTHHVGFEESPRPSKRRRVGSERNAEDNVSDDSDEAFGTARNFDEPTRKLNRPSHEYQHQDAANEPQEEPGPKKSRYRVHVPVNGGVFPDQYFTQVPDDLSQAPWILRGPAWIKPRVPAPAPVAEPPAPEPAQDTPQRVAGNGLRTEFAMSVFKDRPQSKPTPNKSFRSMHEIDDELADLPSDAFSSSQISPYNQPKESHVNGSPGLGPRQTNLRAPLNGLRQTTLFGPNGAQLPPSQISKRHAWPMADKVEPPTHHQLDFEAMETWVYPTNLGTIRDYQFNIVSRGLFHNMLVALPTGLGKTFIAATIMLNWFRWTKDAQIFFVAPTKPLVAQQIDACFGIAGIPRHETSMLTGDITPALRAEEYLDKRVFFTTPQTLLNDLKRGICDPKRMVLLVVDEAHRATGAYAYVEVVKLIRRFNESFRVLALTATPGADVESVQKVIDGLEISRIEIRTEHSLDIRQYVHSRKIEKVVFDNSEEMLMIMDLYSKAVQPVLNVLNTQNAYWNSDPTTLTPFGLTKARQAWFASEAGRNANHGVKGMLNSIFTILASLSHSMDLLKYHGIAPFYNGMLSFKKDFDGGSKSKYRKEIIQNENFEKLMVRLKGWISNPDFIGHPKLEYLRSVIMNHFLDAGDGKHDQAPSSTRVMVFTHWRDSAEEIVAILNRDQPMVRPHVFVGQATSKNSEGMDQKRQLDIVQKFKSGIYNVLVATSIGEEGLDIGEIDLIICYDSKASPIRMLQRMGRTGRKRAGNIVLLQMRGKEENDAEKAKDNYEKMQEKIAEGSEFQFHDDRSRRIVPKGIQPAVDKRVVEIPIENSQPDLPIPTRKGKRGAKKLPPKKFHMPDGVITGFMTASRLGQDNAESDGAARPAARKRKTKTASVDEPAPWPEVDDVLLTPRQDKELQQSYQYVHDAANQVVMAPASNKFPERQCRLSRTKFVSHRSDTVRFVEARKAMSEMSRERVEKFEANYALFDPERDDVSGILVDSADETQATSKRSAAKASKATKATAKPAAPNSKPKPKPAPKAKSTTTKPPPKPRGRPPKKAPIQKRPRLAANASSDMEAESSDVPASSPGMRVRSQAIDLGDDTSGEEIEEEDEMDSELEDFIDDRENEKISVHGSSSQVVEMGMRSGRGKGSSRVGKIFTSDVEEEDDEGDEEVEAEGTQGVGIGMLGDEDDGDSDDDEDLPEISTLMAEAARKSKSKPQAKGRKGAPAPIARRGRRIIAEDDDSD
ncbi:P-loop containing nucleoside triphosphate hydrolase protein [Aulographum hederae CBS 113979]|uniref:ATP-dependent DNA helicase n=1 Tax=Aulographum hederae CBS 113979 TaxID=1176131 RepID=A0A6G1H967_9PEZI|nr:P-loop containing nucleoside triphosphate hydrolase protein [Aulographum hederae CBS 113979]